VKAFVLARKVRFGEVDAAGIAYFARIYDYLHEAFEDFWEQFVGVRYAELILGRRLGFPLVHSEADFRSPLRFGDEFEVRVTCTRLGRSSFEMRYVLARADTVCVDARMTTVCVRLETLEPIALPEELRARVREVLEELPT